MAAIAGELPGVTIISVGHRPELKAFHNRQLTIARKPDGAVIRATAKIEMFDETTFRVSNVIEGKWPAKGIWVGPSA